MTPVASAPDDIRERIESACRFQSHITQSDKGKLPWPYRWPDEVPDDVFARLLALNARRADLERLTGLPSRSGSRGSNSSASSDAPDSDPDDPATPKLTRAKKVT